MSFQFCYTSTWISFCWELLLAFFYLNFITFSSVIFCQLSCLSPYFWNWIQSSLYYLWFHFLWLQFLWFKNSKKIFQKDTRKIRFKLWVILSSMMKCHIVILCLSWDMNYSLIQNIPTVYATFSWVTLQPSVYYSGFEVPVFKK
jgi:hypothetical protein